MDVRRKGEKLMNEKLMELELAVKDLQIYVLENKPCVPEDIGSALEPFNNYEVLDYVANNYDADAILGYMDEYDIKSYAADNYDLSDWVTLEWNY